MRLVALKSTMHLNKWGDRISKSLRFDVVPVERECLEIGDEYVFSSGRNPQKGRRRVEAGVSLTSDPNVLGDLRPLVGDTPRMDQLMGMVSFYPDAEPGFGFAPARITFLVVVDPLVIQELSEPRSYKPGAVTFDLKVENLAYGWEPDGSRKIWNPADPEQDRLPITGFGCAIEIHCSTEGEVYLVKEQQELAELLDSNDPEHRALAKQIRDDQQVSPVERYAKESRTMLLAIFLALLLLMMVRAS